MSASRNRGRRARVGAGVFALIAGLVFVWPAGAGWTQEQAVDGPIRLVPLEPDFMPTPEPDDDWQPEPGLEATEFVPPDWVTEQGPDLESGQVMVGTLSDIDPDSIGLLGEEQGGLPHILWRGTKRSLVRSLLPRLPTAAPSSAMRSLTLRMILSAGEPPEGEGERGDLLRARAQMLADMGEYDVAIDLLRAAPGFQARADLARLESDRLFRDLEYEAACAHVKDNILEFADPHWQRALIFCQTLDQQFEAATLGIDLLRESGHAPEPAFISLVNAAGGFGEATLESLPNPSPLTLAMLRRIELPAPENAVVAANPAILRLIATAPEAPVGLRLAAAERSEAIGALQAADVRRLYATVPFKAQERANPISASDTMSDAMARALFYQAVASETVPTARVELLRAALERGKQGPHFGTMARAVLPAIRELGIRPEFAWFAADAGRALYAAGLWDEAADWFDLASAHRSRIPEAERAVTELWPLAALADRDTDIDPEMFESWWAAQGGETDATAQERANLLLTLFDALGREVPPVLWEKLLNGPMTQPAIVATPALQHALSNAATNGRIGETVLLALVGLGEGGPGDAGLSTLNEIVSGLRVAGLETDARAIALEAALANGL